MDFEEDEQEEEKPKKPTFPLTMFISEGHKYTRLGRYECAMSSFNSALQQEPNNLKSLVGRSDCYMRQGMYAEAKEDAEAALRVNPKFSAAKTLKGEAEYFLGDFEHAYVEYRRAQDSHPNCGAMKLGHQMCRKAIDNALDPDEALVLDDADIVELQKCNQEDEEEHKRKSEMYVDDVACLEYMMSDDIYQSVHADCRDLLEFLENKQSFWKYQRPDTIRLWKVSRPLQPEFTDQKKESSEVIDNSLGEDETLEIILKNEEGQNYSMRDDDKEAEALTEAVQ